MTFRDESSPHTRGCFPPGAARSILVYVFPAYAGVFPTMTQFTARLKSLPRIRGGVSVGGKDRFTPSESSPHTRGCFRQGFLILIRSTVFPAYAGVFLAFPLFSGHAICLPRIRGGVSDSASSRIMLLGSSPHTRGCFRRQSQ